MDASTIIDPTPTTATVATDTVMSQSTPSLVIYCSAKVQTAPPPNAAAFEQIYGRPVTMADLERRVGLAGNGRYSATDDVLHGAMIGPTFEQRLPVPEKKPTYDGSGFQTTPYALVNKALTKAKTKAARTANTFMKVAADDGFIIWAESISDLIVHSEQFSFDIKLDVSGNAPAGADITGHFLRNIYKEETTIKNARDTAAAASKAASPSSLPPVTIAPTRPVRSTVQRTSWPPRTIPALAPAELVVTEDTPAQKAAKEKDAKKKAAKDATEKLKAAKTKADKEKEASDTGTEVERKAEISATQNESFEQSPRQHTSPALSSNDGDSAYYEHEEGGNPFLEPEEIDSAYSHFDTLVVFNPNAPTRSLETPVCSSTSPTKEKKQEAPLSTSRKRKDAPHTNTGSNARDENGAYKRLQITDARGSAAQFLEPHFAKQERTSQRTAPRGIDRVSQTLELTMTEPPRCPVNAPPMSLSKHVEKLDTPRGPRRETRRRSRSPNRNTSEGHNSAAHRDRGEAKGLRRRSRSPKRNDDEATRVMRDRRERSMDRRRATSTGRELGRGKSHGRLRYPSKTDVGATSIIGATNRKSIVDIDLSQTGIPTPPESNKSTPPRTTSKTADTISTLANAADQGKDSEQVVTILDSKSVDQLNQQTEQYSTARQRRNVAVDATTPGTKQGPNRVIVGRNNKNQDDSRIAQQNDTIIWHSGKKRPHKAEKNPDEKSQDASAKRVKRDMKQPASRNGQEQAVQTNSHDDCKRASSIPHKSARTEQKPSEGRDTIPQPSKEDIEKPKNPEQVEQGKRNAKARIAERHANRKPRAPLGAEIQRFVPRQMREAAQNDDADTNRRGGQRDDHRGGRRR